MCGCEQASSKSSKYREMLPCDLQALAKRTVGIFNYPKNSDPAQVSEHAYAYGVRFGEVQRVIINTGRDLQLYAIINFCSADAALAAVQQRQPLLFMGTTVNPSAWKLPWQPISSGGLLGLGHFFHAKKHYAHQYPLLQAGLGAQAVWYSHVCPLGLCIDLAIAFFLDQFSFKFHDVFQAHADVLGSPGIASVC